MAGDRPFSEGIAELKKLVGTGKLTATVEVDQIYAGVQEVGYWLTGPNAGKIIKNHPGGGGKNYLGSQVAEHAETELRSWLSKAISDHVPTVDSAKAFGDALVRGVAERAPVKFNNLRRSASVTVTDDGVDVYTKPAEQPRLTREQLRAQSRQRKRAF